MHSYGMCRKYDFTAALTFNETAGKATLIAPSISNLACKTHPRTPQITNRHEIILQVTRKVTIRTQAKETLAEVRVTWVRVLKN